MPRKPRVDKKCEWVSSRSGQGCRRWAVYRNVEHAVWLCSMHKRHTPGQPCGKQPVYTEGQKLYKKQKARKRHESHQGAQRCAFITKARMQCRAPVTSRLEDGRDVCQRHKQVYGGMDGFEREFLESSSVEVIMETKIPKLKAHKSNEVAVNLPDIEDQIEELDKLADKHDDNTIKFKKREIHPNQTVGTRKDGFFGLDVEYYTPEFKYDYVYMLMTAIRRAEAQVNIYFQQLQRIENEEEELKKTIRSGTMVGEKGVLEFSNTEQRNSIPIELKLKLMDNLTKAEAHYAKLLKQLQELPLVALMVLRKMGVRWDRDAAMMVMNKIEKQEHEVLSDFGAINTEPVEMPLEQMVEIVSQDPKMAKQFKQMAQDDDW